MSETTVQPACPKCLDSGHIGLSLGGHVTPQNICKYCSAGKKLFPKVWAMLPKIEIEVSPDGTIRTIYQDGLDKLARLIGGELTEVKRASRVEYESVAVDGKILHGWTIRADFDPELALRMPTPPPPEWPFQVSRDPKSPLVTFTTRKQALEFEQLHFWELLPPKTLNTEPEILIHGNHGRGDESGPYEEDCPCRGGPQQEACADEGCGFCSAETKSKKERT